MAVQTNRALDMKHDVTDHPILSPQKPLGGSFVVGSVLQLLSKDQDCQRGLVGLGALGWLCSQSGSCEGAKERVAFHALASLEVPLSSMVWGIPFVWPLLRRGSCLPMEGAVRCSCRLYLA